MTGFMSKSHVGRYEIIDVIHYNQPRILSIIMSIMIQFLRKFGIV